MDNENSMNEIDFLKLVASVVESVIKKPVVITMDTDLIEDKILDSLDGMVFLLELEQASGKHFPDDIDMVEQGYYRMRELINYLNN